MQRFFKVAKNTEIFQSGLVVMGDLPYENFRGGENFSKWFHCNGQPTQNARF